MLQIGSNLGEGLPIKGVPLAISTVGVFLMLAAIPDNIATHRILLLTFGLTALTTGILLNYTGLTMDSIRHNINNNVGNIINQYYGRSSGSVGVEEQPQP